MNEEEDRFVLDIQHDMDWWQNVMESLVFVRLLQEGLGMEPRGCLDDLLGFIRGGLEPVEREGEK